jgi:Predicted ATPase
MMDFNDTSGSTPQTPDTERDALRTDLICRLESVLFALYPAGKVRKGKFLIGDVLGSPGDSLEIVLDGDKAGLWTDRATGDGGDIFDLIARHHQIDTKSDFPQVMKLARDLTGRTTVTPPKKHKKEALIDELGPATAKWDYFTAEGQLIGCVYRYDPPGRRKEFRPWDAKRKKMAPPDPSALQPDGHGHDRHRGVGRRREMRTDLDRRRRRGDHCYARRTRADRENRLVAPDRQACADLARPRQSRMGLRMAAADAVLMVGALSCAVLMPPEDKSEGWDVADGLAEDFDVQSFLATGPRISVLPPAQEESEAHDENAVWATDDALALSFTRRYAEDWRYCAQWGKWLVWTGNRWQADDTLLVTHLMRHICREAAIKADSHRLAAKLASSSTVGGVDRLARSDRQHASTSDEWDRDPWLANAPGGVIDLRTGQVRAHDRADRMTKIATATPNGTCPRWLAFLADITENDRDLMVYLQRSSVTV